MGKDNAASVEKKAGRNHKGKLLDPAPHVPSRQVDNSTFFLSAIMYLCPPCVQSVAVVFVFSSLLFARTVGKAGMQRQPLQMTVLMHVEGKKTNRSVSFRAQDSRRKQV
jgi:hypothetical protein